MPAAIHTVGHSTLSREAFLALLASVPIELVWDVRSHPGSHWEWFRRAELERWLPATGVCYRWVPELGGWRGAPPAGALPAHPGGWSSPSFANYEWHTRSDEFARAVAELARVSRTASLALMCAEGVWWRCHRSMIADHLVLRGLEVVHLQPRRTVHREVVEERLLRYHPETLAHWRELGSLNAT